MFSSRAANGKFVLTTQSRPNDLTAREVIYRRRRWSSEAEFLWLQGRWSGWSDTSESICRRSKMINYKWSSEGQMELIRHTRSELGTYSERTRSGIGRGLIDSREKRPAEAREESQKVAISCQQDRKTRVVWTSRRRTKDEARPGQYGLECRAHPD